MNKKIYIYNKMYNDYYIPVFELLEYLKIKHIIKDDIIIDDIISDLTTQFSHSNKLINYKCYGPNIGIIKIHNISNKNNNARCCICRKNVKYNFNDIIKHIESDTHMKNLIYEIAKNFEFDEKIKNKINKIYTLSKNTDSHIIEKYNSPFANYAKLANELYKANINK